MCIYSGELLSHLEIRAPLKLTTVKKVTRASDLKDLFRKLDVDNGNPTSK